MRNCRDSSVMFTFMFMFMCHVSLVKNGVRPTFCYLLDRGVCEDNTSRESNLSGRYGAEAGAG